MLKIKEKAILLVFSIFVFQLAFPQYSFAYGFDQNSAFTTNTNSTTSIIAGNSSSSNDNQVIFYDGGPDASQSCSPYEIIPGISIFTSKQDNSSVIEAVDEIESIRDYVLNEAKKVGLNPNEVDKIIQCESRWDPKAIGHNKNGSSDSGLWQINSIHKTLTLADKLDYKTATKWALEKRLRDGNWSAWYCARKVGIRT